MTWLYLSESHAKPRLNGLKNRFSSWVRFRRIAHIAGVSVSAVRPEISTAVTTVTANCW